VIPAFEKLFVRQIKCGKFTGRTPTFEVNHYGERQLFGKVQEEPTKVFFGHATDPDSLESATAKAVWLDEAGQRKFKLGSWEAINRRTAVNKGRILITTTPYNLGWLYSELYLPWKRANGNHPDIDVVEFESTANPAFPREEFERARKTMPRWKFDLFYRARFTRPAGAIYDCFDEMRHTCGWFNIPSEWPRFVGIDFGGVHTAAVFLAQELKYTEEDGWGDPTGRYYLYREYPERGQWQSLAAREHAKNIYIGEPRMPICVGGAGSEGQWRREFSEGGLWVIDPAVSEESTSTEGRVEVGINRVYSLLSSDKLVIFDTCRGIIDDVVNYSRVLDEATNEPTEKIEDKETYHYCDSLRYIASYLQRPLRHPWIH
jgi:hypothetical protein